MAVLRPAILEPLAVKPHKVAEPRFVLHIGVLEKRGVGRAQLPQLARALLQFLEQDCEKQGARVVVGAIAVGVVRNREGGVLEYAGVVGQAVQVVETPRRKVRMLAELRRGRQLLDPLLLKICSGLREHLRVGVRHLGPDHFPSVEVGVPPHGVEVLLVAEHGEDRPRDGAGIAERNQAAAVVAQQFGGVPVGR